MTDLTNDTERMVLDWLNGDPGVVQPTAPLVVRLLSVAGTEAVAGTEIVGDMYEEQPCGFGLAVTDSGTNTTKLSNPATVTWPALDSVSNVTVVGAEIWDSALVPVRLAHKTYGTSVVVPAGETAVLDTGTLTLTLD